MNITRDLVATIQGPGWSYGMARVVINDENEAAVFVLPGLEPVQVFNVTAAAPNGGTGTTEDGPVRFRRRGSSCQYKLAKCQVNSATLGARWDAWLAS